MHETSLESLQSLLATMKPLLLEIGVKESQIFIVPQTYDINKLAIAFDWLHDIYLSHEYNKAKMIFKSLSPAVWSNYRLLGIVELTEQRLLKEASTPLLRLWKTKRPRIFRNWNNETCEECDVRSKFEYREGFKKCGNCGTVVDAEI